MSLDSRDGYDHDCNSLVTEANDFNDDAIESRLHVNRSRMTRG